MMFQLVMIQIVTFVAIILVLRKLLYAETARETGRLRALTEENSQKERDLAAKIKTAEAAYAEKVAKAEEDIKGKRADANKEIEELTRSASAKAKEEADRIVRVAVNARDKMRDEAANEMRDKIPSLASHIFRDFLSAKVRQATHSELLKEVISEVKKTDKTAFRIKAKKGELISAFPLAGSEKSALLSAVLKKLGRKVPMETKEDKNLVAGVVIKLDTLIIDGSLENRLRQLEQK